MSRWYIDATTMVIAGVSMILLALCMSANQNQPEPTQPHAIQTPTPQWWSLIRMEPGDDGIDEYVVDYNLTFDDCREQMMQANRYYGWSCHVQPDGKIDDKSN